MLSPEAPYGPQHLLCSESVESVPIGDCNFSPAAASGEKARARLLWTAKLERATIGLLIGEGFMSNDSHQRAAEFHDLAAHAHRAAAVHHGKEDHLTGHELARQAMEHSAKAHQATQEALQQSAASAKQKK
jgi:hypothetical protein